ncbi:uncharacterized protein LOC144873494 [Branchiostoma floridae x Branchiostoma japonicum]
MHHTSILKGICRRCGQHIKDRPILSTKYTSEFRDLFGIDLSTDNPDIHPPNICHKCRCRFDWYKKHPKKETYQPVRSPYVFMQHNNESCEICNDHAAREKSRHLPIKRGRKRKRTGHAGPGRGGKKMAQKTGYECRPMKDGTAVKSIITFCTPKKHAHFPDSLQGGGNDFTRDRITEGDRNPPMTGVVGFSKETTLAVLPRMHMEELLSELNRRNIVVKLAGEHQRGRGDLEHVLREVMTREYEVEEGEGMDTSNTSSTFEHSCSNTSSAFQHCSQLKEGGSSEALSRPNNDQASSQNLQELSQFTENEGASSRQAPDIPETSSTETSPEQVQVKKEPKIELDFEQHTNSVAGVTGPSTTQTQYPGIVYGPQPNSASSQPNSASAQPNSASSQNLTVKFKTEPGLEEETEDEQLQDLRSELCPSSPGQLSQELDKVDVSLEDEGCGMPPCEEPVKVWESQEQQLDQGEPETEPEVPQRQKRFASESLYTKQLVELQEGRVDSRTERATRWGTKLFKEWLQSRGLDTAFEELPPRDLAVLLRQFYGEAQKDDGTPYAKASHACLRAAIHRHLTGPPFNCKYNIFKDKEFQAANKVYNSVIRQLKRDGIDTSKSYPPILASDITKMFETKTLSVDNPVALQRLVFFYLAFFFCQRGRENLRDFKVGDFIPNTEGGRRYYTLRYYKHQKDHRDHLPGNVQPSPRLYESPNNTRPCPVQAFELYCSKLHNRCPYLFQRPSTQWKPSSPAPWYYGQPVGQNKLGAMMRDISKAAGLSKVYTNHSITRTAIQPLDKAASSQPNSASSQPNSASSQPNSATSSQPNSASSQPNSASSQPNSATSQPNSASSQPNSASSSQPNSASSQPNSASSQPNSATSQPNSASSQNLIVKIKTEPGLEEETEDELLQDLRSELCPSSPGQLSQELDKMDVSLEDEGCDMPPCEEPVKLWETQKQQLDQGGAETEPEAAQGSQKRCASLDTTQLHELEEGKVDSRTERATTWGTKLFKEWLQSRGLDTAFEELPPRDLAVLLRQFYGEARKDNGTPYAKASYACLRAAIHRHLTGPPYNCKYNILKNKEFKAANKVYIGVLKQLKRDGQDTDKSYPPILTSDITKMFKTKTLSVDNPVALQRLVFFYLSFYFCQRGRENLRNFKVGDFIPNTEGGRKYYTLKNNENQKNHPDRLRENQPSPRLYESPNDTRPCPVQAFELYCSKLSKKCMYLFQRPNMQWKPGYHTDQWYFSQPVGQNKLGAMMRDISKAAGLSKFYTNHSVTVTAIKALDKAGFESRVIMSLSGHRAETSVRRNTQSSEGRQRNVRMR